MSEINYQALREKAEKATKGSYIVGHTSVNQHGNLTGVFVCQKWKGEPGGVIAECHVNCLIESDAQAYANAEFIAEANPATVLALLDERERNQQYIKSRDQENEEIALAVGKLRVELEAAEKRNAKLQSENAYIRNRFKELDLLIGKNILVMQAAIIEWQATGDAKSGLAWIYNTLFGPGELPDESEKDAQAYFNRKYAPIDEKLMALHKWFWEQSEAERAAANIGVKGK
ncbi:TPA: ead/Ea22-like family protein [Escherichia coli]|uniref:ead/Ea22-like family protein n=1 Tax=Escherichia coli TaxID=562 RepID=UPI000E1FEEDF|nr:ead/Ea22-like family protein [Escherichia coli]EFB5461359.1 ead/Ea22-like family protein [Escherichia coli]EFB5486796.1 ead/Ea22-like family protein [Escherichia coli]EFH5149830.1 ead/Ea22-like family protein [Escherichia coli]MBV4671241.1 ead/Ea22-like family protein [Escherichia coli]MDS1647648.1 ead/Ea22-like family protein [Escherichia coli]